MHLQSQRRGFDASDRSVTMEIVPRMLQANDFPWSATGNGERNAVIVKQPGQAPYLLLWDRCVLFPPFFLCGIGALPPARGDLFDAMNDSEKLSGSVPDVDE
jgi:hypothetical protein